MTLLELAAIDGYPSLRTIQRRAAQYNETAQAQQPTGKHSEVTQEFLKFLEELIRSEGRKEKPPQKPNPPKRDTEVQPSLKIRSGHWNWPSIDWRTVLPKLPIPLLGIPAAYGVYMFASYFVPVPVALIEAGGFEMVYIGLMSVQQTRTNKQLVWWTIWGAVLVSVLYNTVAGYEHLVSGWIAGLRPAGKVAISILHGAPLAVLAALVMHLTTQEKEEHTHNENK